MLKYIVSFLILSQIYSQNILHKEKSNFHFSDFKTKDTFSLTLSGTSTLEGNIDFYILTIKNDTIHKESFPARYLLGYGYETYKEINKSNISKSDFIILRMKEFFLAKNFKKPAQTNTDFYKEYTDPEIWAEIISNKENIGFSYLLGEEDGRNLFYSRKLKKIVFFGECC